MEGERSMIPISPRSRTPIFSFLFDSESDGGDDDEVFGLGTDRNHATEMWRPPNKPLKER